MNISLIDRLTKLLFLIAVFGTGCMLLIVFVNVIARFCFNEPFYWAEEVTAYTIAYVTMLPAALLWHEDRHIKLDLFLTPGSRFESFRKITIGVASILFSSVLAWQSMKVSWMTYWQDMREPSLLATPLWIVYSALLIGSVMLLLVQLRSVYRVLLPPRS